MPELFTVALALLYRWGHACSGGGGVGGAAALAVHPPVARQLCGPEEGLWAEVAAAALGAHVALQVVGQVGAGRKRRRAQVAREGLAALVHQQVRAQVAPRGEALAAQVAAVAATLPAAGVCCLWLLLSSQCSGAALLCLSQIRAA